MCLRYMSIHIMTQYNPYLPHQIHISLMFHCQMCAINSPKIGNYNVFPALITHTCLHPFEACMGCLGRIWILQGKHLDTTFGKMWNKSYDNTHYVFYPTGIWQLVWVRLHASRTSYLPRPAPLPVTGSSSLILCSVSVWSFMPPWNSASLRERSEI